MADRLDSSEDNSEDSAVATPVSATAIRAAAREIRATAWRAAAQEKSEQQLGEKDAEWQHQYQLHREAADQQMTALEAQLDVACGSPATPQVVAELEWLEEEWRKVEELEEQQQQPVTGVVTGTAEAVGSARQQQQGTSDGQELKQLHQTAAALAPEAAAPATAQTDGQVAEQTTALADVAPSEMAVAIADESVTISGQATVPAASTDQHRWQQQPQQR